MFLFSFFNAKEGHSALTLLLVLFYCLTGYNGTGTVGTCFNVDECSNGDASCPANSVCIDTVGSYICPCNYGYTKNGEICENIDECAFGNECSQVCTTFI